jgi:hypothetical protein
MSTLFAIRGPRNRTTAFEPAAVPAGQEKRKAEVAPDAQDDSPTTRLLKMIPGEAVSFYGGAVASIDQLYRTKVITDPIAYFWLLVFVTLLAYILLIVIRWKMTKDPRSGITQWQPIVITAISFSIYAYTIGGPFQHYPGKIGPGWLSPVGFIAASFWTSITPYLFEAK